ncbi:MAG TPA: AI-2E family transporter [Bryobacteraceae bacterium]|nr:AI-2E family transporter [Bryobacteraceae bacterium]
MAVLTPLVRRRAVYLPPALIIFSQIILGWLLGFIGFALATPLTAAVLVALKTLYLHERPKHHG